MLWSASVILQLWPGIQLLRVLAQLSMQVPYIWVLHIPKRGWFLKSLTSATFLEVPDRFQLHEPIERSQWQIVRGVEEFQEELAGAAPKVLPMLFQNGALTLWGAEAGYDPLERKSISPETHKARWNSGVWYPARLFLDERDLFIS